ncbi:MAG: hypothetical protein AABM43_07120 [Actinomycetota bacterium]
MLVAVPAASGNGEGHPPGDGHPPAFGVAKFCHRLANNPRLNANQRATVVAACRQLKSDFQAAQAKLIAAVNTAQAEVGQARAGGGTAGDPLRHGGLLERSIR